MLLLIGIRRAHNPASPVRLLLPITAPVGSQAAIRHGGGGPAGSHPPHPPFATLFRSQHNVQIYSIYYESFSQLTGINKGLAHG